MIGFFDQVTPQDVLTALALLTTIVVAMTSARGTRVRQRERLRHEVDLKARGDAVDLVIEAEAIYRGLPYMLSIDMISLDEIREYDRSVQALISRSDRVAMSSLSPEVRRHAVAIGRAAILISASAKVVGYADYADIRQTTESDVLEAGFLDLSPLPETDGRRTALQTFEGCVKRLREATSQLEAKLLGALHPPPKPALKRKRLSWWWRLWRWRRSHGRWPNVV